MGCMLEFSKSLIQCEFNVQGHKQQILVDNLLRYGKMEVAELAQALATSEQEILAVRNGKYFFLGSRADDLAHIFLTFFGRLFFTKTSLIRKFKTEVSPNTEF